MIVWLSRIDPRFHRLVAHRPPFGEVDLVLETRPLLLRHLAHYAVECRSPREDGLYGKLAAGASVAALRAYWLDPVASHVHMPADHEILRLEAAFREGRVLAGHPTWRTLRALHGAWSRMRMGEAVRLAWPNPTPQVVAHSALAHAS